MPETSDVKIKRALDLQKNTLNFQFKSKSIKKIKIANFPSLLSLPSDSR